MKRTLMIAAVACMAVATVLPAQTPTAAADTAIPDRNLFHKSDLYVAGGFVVATVALLPADKHLTSLFRDEDLLANRNVKRIADAGTWFGGPGPVIIGGSMYAVGRLGHIPRMAELALHGTEAVAVGAGVADVIKFAAGRSRPYASNDTNPHDFKLFGGHGSSRVSFPSGHATAAFSVAAAVTAETHEWWPTSTWYVAPVMYGGASVVALSRIYNDQHWASDVVMGAAIGTFAGLKTVRFNHTHTGNKLDRILLGARFTPTANGPAVGFGADF